MFLLSCFFFLFVFILSISIPYPLPSPLVIYPSPLFFLLCSFNCPLFFQQQLYTLTSLFSFHYVPYYYSAALSIQPHNSKPFGNSPLLLLFIYVIYLTPLLILLYFPSSLPSHYSFYPILSDLLAIGPSHYVCSFLLFIIVLLVVLRIVHHPPSLLSLSFTHNYYFFIYSVHVIFVFWITLFRFLLHHSIHSVHITAFIRVSQILMTLISYSFVCFFFYNTCTLSRQQLGSNNKNKLYITIITVIINNKLYLYIVLKY